MRPAKQNNKTMEIIAFDSFKGCITSSEAGEAFAQGRRAKGHETHVLAMSDGGDGMLDAFLPVMGGHKVKVNCHDALMRHITASYGMSADTAIIEVAQVCGLSLIEPEQRNALRATSYGLGELIADAVAHGAHHMVIGLGGTATSDCGMGMLKALLDRLGKRTDDTIDGVLEHCFKGISVTLASDVTNPLYGPEGAAHVFARQKGATDEQIEQIDRRAKRFADISARHCGYDRSACAGAGAAGGLGYAFMQFMNAKMASGAELLLKWCHFDELLAHADMVFTGEGHSDRQTLMGKLPGVLLRHARQAGVRVCLLSGGVSDKDELLKAGFYKVESINEPDMPLQEAMKPEVAKARLAAWNGLS